MSLNGRKNLIEVDYKALISRGDVVYSDPNVERQEGLPVGNGWMGSLVWTEGSALMFQINRVDTWGCDRTHNKMHSVFYQHTYETTDNLLSCGRLAVDPGGNLLEESLSLYEGIVDVTYASSTGKVKAKTFVWSEGDVLVVRVEDERKVPEEIIIELSLWRHPFEKFGDLIREYSISEKDGKVLLVQKCSEKKFFSHYALALGVLGRKARILHAEQNRMMLAVNKGNEPFTVFLASAASLDPEVDVAAEALGLLSESMNKEYDEILSSHCEWWSNFWEKSFIYLTSTDGVADYLERLYNIHLYQMASSSRGAYPPKFNGMLWLTEPNGKRLWGAQYWVWNMETLYFPIYASNHLEISDPYFKLYRDMLPLCEIAARQRWGADGAYYPEVTPFNGPVTLKKDQALEVREFLLGKRSRESISADTVEKIKYDGVLDYIPLYAHWGNLVLGGQFTWHAHILSSGCELAMQYWWRYLFSGDENWLREMAYPVMKATVQFYMEYFKKKEDGLYHIYPTNVHEAYWGVEDGIMDLAAVRGVVPRLIEASKTLDLDEDMRPEWAEFLEHLTPYPPGDHPDVVRLQGAEKFPSGTFGAGYCRHVEGRHNHEIVWLTPVFPFEDITLARGKYQNEKEAFDTALRTYYVVPQRQNLFSRGQLSSLSRLPIFAARLGLSDEVQRILPMFAAVTQAYPNGITVEGKFGGYSPCLQYPNPQGSGLLASAIQESLLQSTDDIIMFFPAWPSSWDASFRLLARGGFLVSSSIHDGEVLGVEIESTWGRNCRIANPWDSDVQLYRESEEKEVVRGEILEFTIDPGEKVILLPVGRDLAEAHLTIRPQKIEGVQTLEVEFENGRKERIQLGK